MTRPTGAALVAAALLAPALVAACANDDVSDSAACVPLADGSCVVETFANPPALEPDADGVHRLSLAATEVVLDGQRHCVRAYNGGYTAPTIDARLPDDGGDRSVHVDLANRLGKRDYRSLDGGACTCTDAAGDECDPQHGHGACSTHDHGECTCVDADGAECEHLFDFNTTNLHAHGSHVWPDYARGGADCEPTSRDGVVHECRTCGGDPCASDASETCFHADDVLNALGPGEGARYRWDLDEDGPHHTGLQWYHPHIHGTTAMQVASGAAGALIVRGALDELPGVADARERVMIFSTPSIGQNGFVPLGDGEVCTDETLTFNDFSVLGATTSPQVNVINGVRRPRLLTAPHQVERWRILHAGFLDEVFLGLFRGADSDCSDFSTAEGDVLELTQIGRDGLILPETFADDYFFMSPGYRIEAMLGGAEQLEDGETWCLVAARLLQDADEGTFGEFGEQPMSPPEPPTRASIFRAFEALGDVVAIVNVTDDVGAPTTTTLPDYDAIGALAPPTELDGMPIDERCAAAQAMTDARDIDQVAVLQVGFWTVDDPDPCDCEGYNVNCNNFESVDRERYAYDRDLPLGAVEHWRVGASVDGHPFHIHINPYLVCPAPNAFDPIPFPHWRDTYLVNAGRVVDVITENRAFTGPFVFHCHKLTHEDHGMMELIRVCDPASDETCGDYDWRACDDDDLTCIKARAATDCALGALTPAEAAACTTALGGPGGVCGPNACVDDSTCGAGTCEDNVCSLPAGPP